jgi:hypothetical protein
MEKEKGKCEEKKERANFKETRKLIIFRRFRKIAENYRHFCPSVRMEKLGPTMDGFSLNFIFKAVSKICRDN